jgi:hypothetical protein
VRDRVRPNYAKSITAVGTVDALGCRMRVTALLISLVVAACDSRMNDSDDDYCPNASCILNLCECGSDSCTGIEPHLCGSDIDCGSGQQCTSEIDDTQQCSVTCNDGACPAGYFCQTYIP